MGTNYILNFLRYSIRAENEIHYEIRRAIRKHTRIKHTGDIRMLNPCESAPFGYKSRTKKLCVIILYSKRF